MSRKYRLKPAGYIVLGILFLVIVLCIYAIIHALSGSGKNDPIALPETTPAVSEEPLVVTVPPTQDPTAFGSFDTDPEILDGSDDDTDPVISGTEPEKDEESETDVKTAAPEEEKTPSPSPTASPRVPSSSEKKKAKAGTLNNDGVNLRSGPSTGYERIGSYDKGATMQVYDKDGDFYFVKMDKDGKVGFMAKKFITVSDSATVTVPPEVPKDAVPGKVSASTVALRSGPNKSDSAITTLKRGEGLFVYYKVGEFYYVEVSASGKKGFAFAQYVSVDGEVPSK